MSPIDTYRATLDPDTLAMVDALRGLAAAAGPALNERIKWNAPSFAIGDEDRITLGLERKGGVRVVLHRGAKAKDSAGFDFPDPDKLARWPASDRGVLTFATLAEIEMKRPALGELFARWLEQTA
ncbi:DUF1801 domain-containing protein [Caulobacter sp. SLTY]|uniref:DUF1801 domain-containing protein n=1 Tax=Caulobacter sp. SLTY TaxID=2683262 RepID=UPI0014136AA0|nr:DUF1801 domain-containing protein [Caulobacter sp. SLTY]NBB17131.1 DUF1801 domain-containing protein [Caulobacter sp. SLTY]